MISSVHLKMPAASPRVYSCSCFSFKSDGPWARESLMVGMQW